MYPRKCNIIRSICRSLEILLFFVISIVGFSLFAKTTSSNSKTKVKSLSGSPIVPRELSVPVIKLHNHLYYFSFSPRHYERDSSISRHSGNHTFTSSLYQGRLTHAQENYNQSITYHTLAFTLPQPHNLFQQNRILLI
ncbi:MAG: hypothetical protein HGA59_08340 [Chlorobiaceae bacterium]|nr:hypothetical protein [Chlorobiaceae bacterium]